MKSNKKKLTDKEKLANAEKVLATKELHYDDKNRFEETLKKAVNTKKQRGSK
jgi:hypothetical protein